ncbi:SCO family protein [Paenibacillus sp. J2TS4]|uniref:SCO family protein n=1 Tax=Paenibacillus sp. J2TS4 TaxID=2807194 RepID=UPI001BCAA504|nr:SCO family protein [Paenibacillus sp. J2TS4]
MLFVLTVIIVLLAAGCGKPPDNSKLNWPVQDFTFTNQEGQAFGLADLKGKVWIADFVFTNCVTVCLPMTSNLALLQQKLRDAGVDVEIVSFTVDPARDTPEVLKTYGQNYEADFANWHFLTGYTQDEIKKFSEGTFRSAVQNDPNSDQVIHGTAFYLVNPAGVIVSRYEGAFDTPFEQIIQDAKSILRKEKAK